MKCVKWGWGCNCVTAFMRGRSPCHSAQQQRRKAGTSALEDAQSRFQRPASAGERAALDVLLLFASSRSSAMTSSSPLRCLIASSRRCRAPSAPTGCRVERLGARAYRLLLLSSVYLRCQAYLSCQAHTAQLGHFSNYAYQPVLLSTPKANAPAVTR